LLTLTRVLHVLVLLVALLLTLYTIEPLILHLFRDKHLILILLVDLPHQILWVMRTLTLLVLLQQVFWLAIEILLALKLLTTVALESAVKVVVLTLRADPATIWEVELVSLLLSILQSLLLLFH
jgi:hypothetical protein